MIIIVGYLRRYIEMTCRWPLLHTDLTLPRSIRQAQFLHQIVPSRAPTLLFSQISEQFLSLVHQDLEISSVMPIFVGGLKVLGQVENLRRQDRDLDFGRASIGPRARGFRKMDGSRLMNNCRRFRG